MAQGPQFKVYDADGSYQAACKNTALAAAVVALLGDGATVRYQHKRVLWTEGEEDAPAGDSYDLAAETMLGRLGLGPNYTPRPRTA